MGIIFLGHKFKGKQEEPSLRKSNKETKQKGQKKPKPLLYYSSIISASSTVRKEEGEMKPKMGCEEEKVREEEAKKKGNMVGKILDSLQAVFYSSLALHSLFTIVMSKSSPITRPRTTSHTRTHERLSLSLSRVIKYF